MSLCFLQFKTILCSAIACLLQIQTFQIHVAHFELCYDTTSDTFDTFILISPFANSHLGLSGQTIMPRTNGITITIIKPKN